MPDAPSWPKTSTENGQNVQSALVQRGGVASLEGAEPASEANGEAKTNPEPTTADIMASPAAMQSALPLQDFQDQSRGSPQTEDSSRHTGIGVFQHKTLFPTTP